MLLGLLTTTLLEKQNQFYKTLMNKIIRVKRKRDEFVLLPHSVPIITVIPNITQKEKCLG